MSIWTDYRCGGRCSQYVVSAGSGRVPGFETRGNIFEAQAAIGQQDNEVVDEIRGLVDGLLLTPGGGGEGEFDAFLTEFLCDPAGACRGETRGVALGTTSGKSGRDDGFEFGDKVNVGSGHVESSDAHIDRVVCEVLLQVRNGNLGAVEYTGRQCAIDLCRQEHVAKVLQGAGTARRD